MHHCEGQDMGQEGLTHDMTSGDIPTGRTASSNGIACVFRNQLYSGKLPLLPNVNLIILFTSRPLCEALEEQPWRLRGVRPAFPSDNTCSEKARFCP
jgi:hypothetical protein